MQSLKSERAKKEYEQFVKEVTPKQNLFCNMAKAFIVGGLICVVGQILLHAFGTAGSGKGGFYAVF